MSYFNLHNSKATSASSPTCDSEESDSVTRMNTCKMVHCTVTYIPQGFLEFPFGDCTSTPQHINLQLFIHFHSFTVIYYLLVISINIFLLLSFMDFQSSLSTKQEVPIHVRAKPGFDQHNTCSLWINLVTAPNIALAGFEYI